MGVVSRTLVERTRFCDIGWLGLDEIFLHVWISCYFHSHVVKMNKQFDQTYFSDGKKNTYVKSSWPPFPPTNKNKPPGETKKKTPFLALPLSQPSDRVTHHQPRHPKVLLFLLITANFFSGLHVTNMPRWIQFYPRIGELILLNQVIWVVKRVFVYKNQGKMATHNGCQCVYIYIYVIIIYIYNMYISISTVFPYIYI